MPQFYEWPGSHSPKPDEAGFSVDEITRDLSGSIAQVGRRRDAYHLHTDTIARGAGARSTRNHLEYSDARVPPPGPETAHTNSSFPARRDAPTPESPRYARTSGGSSERV